MSASNKELGTYGEDLAVAHLEGGGASVLDRNWRCRHGELDVVALDRDGALAFVEVKTRRSTRYGTPLEAVTATKAARLRRLACLWLDAHRGRLPEIRQIRIDVVAITVGPAGDPDLVHLKAVA